MSESLRLAIVANANSIHTIRWVNWLRKKGHHVSVFSLNESEDCVYFGPEPPLDRSLIFNLGSDVRKTTRKLQAAIDDFKPDIVHGFFLVNHGMYASRVKGYPKVVTALGSDVLLVPKESKLLSWIVKRTVKNANLVVSVAEHITQTILSWKNSHAKVITSPIGIDNEVFKPLKKKNHVIFTRGFKEIYDPLTLVKAISYLSSQIKDYHFTLCGDGPLLKDCKTYTEENNLSDVIEFPGYISNEELVELVGVSKVLVSPALSDGTPVSILEGLACGCIIVSSDIPANRFWTLENKTGVLFRPEDYKDLGDKLIKVIKDENLSKTALIEGPDLVLKYADWSSCISDIEKQYFELI